MPNKLWPDDSATPTDLRRPWTETALWRDTVADVTFVASWASCVGISASLVYSLTGRIVAFCLLPSIPLGSLLFWGAISMVNVWCRLDHEAKRRRASRS